MTSEAKRILVTNYLREDVDEIKQEEASVRLESKPLSALSKTESFFSFYTTLHFNTKYKIDRYLEDPYDSIKTLYRN